MFGYPVLRSKPQWWMPELRFGYPPLRNFPKPFWEKLGIFLESLGGSQRQLCIKTRPLTLVPVFVPGEHPPKPHFWKTTLLATPKYIQAKKASSESKKLHLQAKEISAPKSQRSLRFAIAMPIADPRNRERFPRQETAILHCDVRLRWKVASRIKTHTSHLTPF